MVVTNNTVTFEARCYARDLGVEIIAEPEWNEFEQIIRNGKVDNPNQHKGLFGIMIASYLNNRDYLGKALPDADEEKAKNKNELKIQILSEFDEAEECVKEAAYLQQKAAQFQQRALDIQKRALPQQVLIDLAADLCIGGAKAYNELSRTHWAIKRVNLVEVLEKAGYRVFKL